jgi:tetratricopeptide (TPR) repeat protein
MSSTKKIIIAVFIILAIAGAVSFLSSQQKAAPAASPAIPTASVAMPSLDRPVVVPPTFPADAEKLIREKIANVTGELKKDNSNMDNWLALAVYRKMMNDYDGAREIWEYVASVRPGNFVPYANLGDLYGYYLKDPAKAETDFLKALEIDKTQVSVYYNTAMFYKDVLNDKTKARAILEKGIKLNPQTSENLKILLKTL